MHVFKPDYALCYRCKSIHHSDTDCSFPAKEKLDVKTAPMANQDRWYHNNREAATISMQASANIQPPASMFMSAKSVVDPNPRCSAPHANASHMKLSFEAFRQGLATHSDRDFAKRIIEACSNGVSIGYEGSRFYWEYN